MESWGRWNWPFHSALYEPANRAKMLALVKNLNVNCDRYSRLHLAVTRDQHRAGQAHHELLEACKTKDPDLAFSGPVETHHRRGTIAEGVHHGPSQAALVNRRGGY